MRKLNIEVNIPESIKELRELKGKVVGISRWSDFPEPSAYFDFRYVKVPKPLVYFKCNKRMYEFLEQRRTFAISPSRIKPIAASILSFIAPEEYLQFTDKGINLLDDHIKCYLGKDRGYRTRQSALEKNGLWLPITEARV